MRRVLHLSDMHFGRAHPGLVDPLVAAINALAPDLVAISGDLTQRARNSQYAQARAFIDRLDPPVLCVPGNHDTPLDNLFLRIFNPWGRYRRWISGDLEPEIHDSEMSVVGVNTVNRWVWQSGRIGRHTVARVCGAFGKQHAPRIRIAVLHHPLEHPPGAAKKPARGADKAIDALSECGADIVLTGHLHSWGVGAFAARKGKTGALQVQAGTGLSTRLRGEANDFNLLTLDGPDAVSVERYVADHGAMAFAPAERRDFIRGSAGWTGVTTI